jgi:hypothetical protein
LLPENKRIESYIDQIGFWDDIFKPFEKQVEKVQKKHPQGSKGVAVVCLLGGLGFAAINGYNHWIDGQIAHNIILRDGAQLKFSDQLTLKAANHPDYNEKLYNSKLFERDYYIDKLKGLSKKKWF